MDSTLYLVITILFWPLILLLGYINYLAQGKTMEFPMEFSNSNIAENENMISNFSFNIVFIGGGLIIAAFLIYLFEMYGVISSYIAATLSLSFFVFAFWRPITKRPFGSIVTIVFLGWVGFYLPFSTSKPIVSCFSSALFAIAGIHNMGRISSKTIASQFNVFLKRFSFTHYLLELFSGAKKLNNHKFRIHYFYFQGFTIALIVLFFVFLPKVEHLFQGTVAYWIEQWNALDIKRKHIPYITFFIYSIMASLRVVEMVTTEIKRSNWQLVDGLLSFGICLLIAMPLSLLTLAIFALVLAIGLQLLGHEFGIMLAFFIFAQWLPGIHAFLLMVFQNTNLLPSRKLI